MGSTRSVGVADGVGGWVELGIDAGMFSRELMERSHNFVKTENEVDPANILHHAYFNTNALGTCTACIVCLDGEELKAINVGDSGFSVFRRSEADSWAVYFQTTEQVHFFN